MEKIVELNICQILARFLVDENYGQAIEEINLTLLTHNPHRCEDPRNCAWTEEEYEKLEAMER